MRASYYAKAIHDIAASGDALGKDFMGNVVATINKNGHGYMLPKILKSLERLIAKNSKKGAIEVITATEIPETEVAQLLKKEPFSGVLSPNHRRVVRRVDPSIIGGVVVKTSTARVDLSHKNMLIGIYQQMTNHL